MVRLSSQKKSKKIAEEGFFSQQRTGFFLSDFQRIENISN
jgi:hypothetical protein